ncbi:MAG: FdhF/YdeP family oxidoreductase [Rhodothermales bacterium]
MSEPDASSDQTPKAQPPEKLAGIKLKKPRKKAAGLPSIISTVKHAKEELGLYRGMKLLLQANQTDGFDCPGCAWPDPATERSSLGEYCENGAKAVAEEATLKRITADFFKQHSVFALSEQSDMWLGKQGRLTEPMVLRKGASHYEPISWDNAFLKIGQALNELASPDEAIFYTSGRTSNEAAFLFQLFGRQFGTNNFPDCSNMCHESSGTGLGEVIGIGKGTVKLEDFYIAETIVVIGQNPGTNHPRMLSALQKAKRNGCKIIHINPLPETGLKRFKHPQEVLQWVSTGTKLADQFIQVRINGDVALLKGIMKAMLEAEDAKPGSVLATEFIASKTEGVDAFLEDLRTESWAVIVERSGISKAEIEQAAQTLIASDKTIVCWAMGLTQHKNAVANIQSCANLLLMRGQIGKPGAGACPVRGHSNVQGDRTVGITARPKSDFLDALAENFDFEPPRAPGLDTVEAIHAMHAGKAKVFFALGGNFLSATPDTMYTAAALQNCRLTVQVSTKLNRSHLITGEEALILPCLGRTEKDIQQGKKQFVTVENSMGLVHKSQGSLEPASPHLLSEPAIVCRLAQATLRNRSSLDWGALPNDYDLIRTTIEATLPAFYKYNERVREPNGFYLPNGPREGKFSTPNGKAKFTVHPIPAHNLSSTQYMMMTIRSHDQFNTTIYGLDDRYRGIHGERRVVMMHPEDIKAAGLKEKDIVDLTSHFEGQERHARRFYVVPFSIPRQCVATYFPETNVLVPAGLTADKSNTPASKSIVVSIQLHSKSDS